jgi:hypothetical protein
MKKLDLIIGFALVALVAILVIVVPAIRRSSIAGRPVRLVITGPVGQGFSGSYIADGVTNSISALAPATVSLQANDVSYEFVREGGGGEFRVALYVGQRCRISTTSEKRQGVRGQLRYTSASESYWAAGF